MVDDASTDQLPQVRGVIERTWDDEWTALYLEFVLYAKRNPASRARSSPRARGASARRRSACSSRCTRASVASPDFPVPVLGDGLDRVVRRAQRSAGSSIRASFTQETLTDALHVPLRHDRRRQPAAARATPTRNARSDRGRAALRPRFSQRIEPDAHERVADAGRGGASRSGRRAWRRGPRGSGPSAWRP